MRQGSKQTNPPQTTTRKSNRHPMRILLVEDNAARAERRLENGRPRAKGSAPIVVRVHRIAADRIRPLATASYRAGALKPRSGGRASIALKLLDRCNAARRKSLVVAGTAYGCNRSFLRGVLDRGLKCVVELRPSTCVHITAKDDGRPTPPLPLSKLLKKAKWREIRVQLPQLGRAVPCRTTELGLFRIDSDRNARLFAVDVGAIEGAHRVTIIGAATDHTISIGDLTRALYWTRWIRPLVRRQERSSRNSPKVLNGAGRPNGQPALKYRANITLARRQDHASLNGDAHENPPASRGQHFGRAKALNVVELFAGAGGMGLGFLMASHQTRSFRLIFSAELHPIYAETLRQNYKHFADASRNGRDQAVPHTVQPIDLRERRAMAQVVSEARSAGGVDILIGGPPCQGFSNANRNSWSSSNPHNELISVFMKYVERLRPSIFLMENVQGITWTARHGKSPEQPSVADHILKRMKAAGYMVFPKLLDAVWYGVPQYRTRFFVIGIHEDIGYEQNDFGALGPFPRPTHGPSADKPFVSVRQAISDLPRIGNGHDADRTAYVSPSSSTLARNEFLRLMRGSAPKGMVSDHITSRHAEYVIERYKRIPPGGNWQDIVEMMSNYANVSRTHSNIYRRLAWDQPSITIGHYRKSMLVHPEQHRGLSLREASRLQSFPDWFQFAGATDGQPGGLVHKQQQLANAVSPLVTKCIAEFILGL